jgi:hypothetical protein
MARAGGGLLTTLALPAVSAGVLTGVPQEPVRLVAGKTYTLPAWAMSEIAGALGLITGTGWHARVSSEHSTADARVDDVTLEEGPDPTPYREPGTPKRLHAAPSADGPSPPRHHGPTLRLVPVGRSRRHARAGRGDALVGWLNTHLNHA